MPTVYLNGGPCDGQTKQLSQAQFAKQVTQCQGATYLYNPGERKKGHRYVFDFYLASPPPGGGGGGGGVLASTNVYKAWPDLERTVNVHLPSSIHRITVSQIRLLNTLTHKRRMRH